MSLALILVGLGAIFVFQSFNFGKLRLIACDVGQGDGILMITPQGKEILVDGGPGTKIIQCLSEKMPFWDRTIEMIVLTHPQRDHLEGLLEVVTRYEVKTIATTQVENDTELFEAWQKAVDAEGARIYVPKSGDQMVADSVKIDVLWPTSEWLDLWKIAKPGDLNETSVVLRVSLGNFCAYLTGDLPKELLSGLFNKSCQVLKISHHGSKTGTDIAVLEKAIPQIAIIQVGHNSFGHPHKEVLNLIESKGIKIFRNDIKGIIEIVTDGQSFKVKSEK